MDNIELEQKVLEIIKEDNYFELITKALAFEKEYKTSDFYKATKKSLMEVIRESRIHYALQLRDMTRQLQKMLDSLDLSNVNQVLEQMSSVFANENEEIQTSLEDFKNLKS